MRACLTALTVYDIQTSYKGAVYSVKLKMEFTILNQLMNLVKGNLREGTSSSPHAGSKSHNFSRHPGARSTYGGGSQLGQTLLNGRALDETAAHGVVRDVGEWLVLGKVAVNESRVQLCVKGWDLC